VIFDTHLTVVPVLLIEGSGIYFPKVWGPRPLSPGNGRTYTTGMWDSTAMLVRRLRWFLPLCLALAACAPAAGPADLGQAATPFSGPPRALVVDSDMDGDSLMALLYLLQRPDLDLLAITVSGTGLTHCAAGVANALGLVALVGHAPIPVACGSETTLGEGHTSSPDWRAAADAGYGLALPEGGKPAAGTAVEVLTAVLGAAPAPVLVLTLGPLTNLAQALLAQPALVDHIAMIYVMGGALNVDGNVEAAPLAEWNVYIDPQAAQVVLASGAPVTLVPLDATNTLPVTAGYARQITQQAASPAAQAVAQVLAAQSAEIEAGGLYFWDVLAAVLVSEPGLAATRPATVQVVTSGPDAGRTVEAADGARVLVADEPSPARFAQLFLATLNAED